MARHQDPVLSDTNVIIESHRVAAWQALTGGYRVETVEECVAESLPDDPRMKLGGIDFPSALMTALRDHRLVVFAGAGVSMGKPASIPDFRTLAKQIAQGTGEDITGGRWWVGSRASVRHAPGSPRRRGGRGRGQRAS